jgi:transcriptional regulator with XRE-family HTH domain
MNAGAKLKLWRGGKTLSQTALAGAVGVGQSALAEWESGRRRPELPHAIQLESLTGGEVPFESWGYPADLWTALAEVVRIRAHNTPANDNACPATPPPAAAQVAA